MSITNKKQHGVGVIRLLFLTLLVLIGLVVLFYIYTELNKAYWDRKVRALCEKDGGVTVYETVELTIDEYIKNDGINGVIRVPSESAAYAKNYEYLRSYNEEVIHKKNPIVVRRESVIYRKSDKKRLGKSVYYSRSGGDFPTIISHPSGFSCKDVSGINFDIEGAIFFVAEGESK